MDDVETVNDKAVVFLPWSTIEPEALNSLGNFWQALGNRPRSVHAPSAEGLAEPTGKNIITGTSQADIALLVVPADLGGFEGAFSRASKMVSSITGFPVQL